MTEFAALALIVLFLTPDGFQSHAYRMESIADCEAALAQVRAATTSAPKAAWCDVVIFVP